MNIPVSTPIPTDMLQDAQGRWVPRTLIKEIDLLRDQVVRGLIDEARIISSTLANARERLFSELDAFLSLSTEQYGVTVRGDRGNVTLFSFDGRLKVQRSVHDNLVFDERLQAAKTLIDQCVTEWSADSNDKIQTLVQHAFQVDKAGQVNTERVLGLRRLKIDDPKWLTAMQAISDAIQVTHSTTYLRFYERIGETEWRPISLDITKARHPDPIATEQS